MSFGERLRSAREIKGYTQQQVADHMHIDKSTYCGYETGKRQPDVSKIKKLARFLGVSGDYLLETGHKETENSPAELMLSEGEQMLIDLFRQVPLDKQQLVLQMIRAALENS